MIFQEKNILMRCPGCIRPLLAALAVLIIVGAHWAGFPAVDFGGASCGTALIDAAASGEGVPACQTDDAPLWMGTCSWGLYSPASVSCIFKRKEPVRYFHPGTFHLSLAPPFPFV